MAEDDGSVAVQDVADRALAIARAGQFDDGCKSRGNDAYVLCTNAQSLTGTSRRMGIKRKGRIRRATVRARLGLR